MHQPNAGSPEFRTPAAKPREVQYGSLKVGTLMRQECPAPGSPWQWAINPYEGCEFACTFCQVRLNRKDPSAWRDFDSRIGVKANAVGALLRDLDRLEPEDVEGRMIALGTVSDPWQPAEEHFRVTRALLEALLKVQNGPQALELNLRISTRSSLIARDTDLIRGLRKATVTFSIASLDERLNRLLEPRAPSAFRRLAALEALARAGVEVGLMVSPVMPGLSQDERGLEALLTRAANAGARFAGMAPMHFEPGQRQVFLAHTAAMFPEVANKFRQLTGKRSTSDNEWKALQRSFDGCCSKLGLTPLAVAMAAKPAVIRPPAQLPLFEGSGTL